MGWAFINWIFGRLYIWDDLGGYMKLMWEDGSDVRSVHGFYVLERYRKGQILIPWEAGPIF